MSAIYRVGKVRPWAEAALGPQRFAIVRRCRLIDGVGGRTARGPWWAEGIKGRVEARSIVEAVNGAAGEVVLDG
jgi:hypothetical protein